MESVTRAQEKLEQFAEECVWLSHLENLCKAQPMFLVMILFALCCRLLTMNCQNENKIRVNLR